MDTRKIKIKLTLRPAPRVRISSSIAPKPTQFQQQTFARFPKLALELQLLIWEETVKFARVIKIENAYIVLAYPDGRINTTKNIVAKGPIPAVLHVCQQSRKAGLKVYQLISKKYCDDPFYINPNVDAILMHGTSDLQALWTHHDYWFPERRDEPLFGMKLPILILDPSHGSDSRFGPKDPEQDFTEDGRRILRPGYYGLFEHFLFCFDKIVILQPRTGGSIEGRIAYENFVYNFWKDVARLVKWAKNDREIEKRLPGWSKDGVKIWPQSRFRERILDEKWNSNDSDTAGIKWQIGQPNT